jgi:hypothetical protein
MSRVSWQKNQVERVGGEREVVGPILGGKLVMNHTTKIHRAELKENM